MFAPPPINSTLGEGASWAFGADGGPISSNDEVSFGFTSGPFGGGAATASENNHVMYLVVAALVFLGFMQWLSSLNR